MYLGDTDTALADIPEHYADDCLSDTTVGFGTWIRKFDDVIGDRFTIDTVLDIQPLYGDDREDPAVAADETYDVAVEELSVDESAYPDMVARLHALDVDTYWTIDPDGDLPKEAIAGSDVVQIASPNSYHEEQTQDVIDSVAEYDQDTIVIPEKAYGSDMDAFYAVKDAAEEEDVVVYPHLHYYGKALTRWLDAYADDLVDEYGLIDSLEMAFVEEADTANDLRRTWIFDEDELGITGDWIHPRAEIGIGALDASFDSIDTVDGYVMPQFQDVGVDDPTAAKITYDAVSGDNFTDDATATEIIGKGFDATHKVAELTHADGGTTTIVYDHADPAQAPLDDGRVVFPDDGSDRRMLELQGWPSPYEVLADVMVWAYNEQETPLSWDEQEELYRLTYDVTDELFDGEPATDPDTLQTMHEEALRTGNPSAQPQEEPSGMRM